MAKTYLAKIDGIDVASFDESMLNNLVCSNFMQPKQLSHSTLKVLKSLVNRSLGFAHTQQIVASKVQITAQIKQSANPKPNAFSEEEAASLERLVLCTKKFYAYGVVIGLHTGLRIGELLALRWTDVDFEKRQIYVQATRSEISFEKQFLSFDDDPKTISSFRQIPISSMLLPILKELKQWQNGKSEFVVCGKDGKRVFIRAYQECFARLQKRLGIKHRGFHSLRHTFAKRCFHNGMDIKTLSEILGHSNPNVTLSVYVHTDDEIKRNAIDMVAEKIYGKPQNLQ